VAWMRCRRNPLRRTWKVIVKERWSIGTTVLKDEASIGRSKGTAQGKKGRGEERTWDLLKGKPDAKGYVGKKTSAGNSFRSSARGQISAW